MNGEKSKLRLLVSFIVLTFMAGIAFKVPYFKTVYYDSLLNALGVTNAQLGSLTGTYALVKSIIYIPGGIVVDKMDTRKVISFSTLLLAVLTFWYAALPGFFSLQFIHVLFAFSNVFFWVAFIKGIRILGKNMGEGKMFGYSEGIRAIAGTVITLAGLGILDVFMSKNAPVAYALAFYGIVFLIFGIILWFVLPKEMSEKEETTVASLKDYLIVLKIPAIWLVSLLVFFAYGVQAMSEYTTPYLTQVMGMTVAMAGIIATIRSYAIGIFSAPIAGTIADKVGSSAKVIFFLFIFEILFIFGLFLTPGNPSSVMIAITIVLLFSIVFYALRGIYYATMKEANVPIALTGTATGIVSVLGYLPDTFVHNMCGGILDNYPGIQGFKYIFLLIIGFAIAGLLVTTVIIRKSAKNKVLMSEEVAAK